MSGVAGRSKGVVVSPCSCHRTTLDPVQRVGMREDEVTHQRQRGVIAPYCAVVSVDPSRSARAMQMVRGEVMRA